MLAGLDLSERERARLSQTAAPGRRHGKAQAKHGGVKAKSKQSVLAVNSLRCLALQTVLDLRLLSKECMAEAAAEAERQRGHGESIFSLELLSVRASLVPDPARRQLVCSCVALKLQFGLASYAILPQLNLRCVLRIAGVARSGVGCAAVRFDC